MASFVFNVYATQVFPGTYDLSSATVKVALVMTNTTVDTEKTAQTLADFSVLDEYDGAAYARQTLASKTITQDDVNNRGVFDAADATFATLGAGTRQAAGMLILLDLGGADSANIPIAFIDTGGFPFTGNGSDVAVTWNVDGIVQGNT